VYYSKGGPQEKERSNKVREGRKILPLELVADAGKETIGRKRKCMREPKEKSVSTKKGAQGETNTYSV